MFEAGPLRDLCLQEARWKLERAKKEVEKSSQREAGQRRVMIVGIKGDGTGKSWTK